MMNRRAFLSGIAAFGAIAPLSAIAANNAGPLMTRNNLADLNDPAAARLATVVPTYVPTTTAMAALNPAKDLLAVFTATGAAGAFEVLTLASLSAGEQAAAAADNAARRICYVIPTADATKVYRRIYSGPISVLWAGAAVDGTTNDSAAINAALTLSSNLGGGTVQLGVGTSVIKPVGLLLGLPYCLSQPSNVTISGFGIGASVLKIVADVAIGHTPYLLGIVNSGLNTLTYANTNLGARDFSIDGNGAANYALGYTSAAIWYWGVRRITLSNIYSHDCGTFGFWMRYTDSGYAEDIVSINPTLFGTGGSDTFHLSDATNWKLSGIEVECFGDDVFVIDATDYGSHDVSVDGIAVRSTGRGNGIRMFGPDASTLKIYNISILGAEVTLSGATAGPAIVMATAAYKNIVVDANVLSTNAASGASHLSLDSQSGVGGEIRQCTFRLRSQDCVSSAIACFAASGVMADNHIEASIYNPYASGSPGPGISLQGTGWTGTIDMNYAPSGGKTTGSPIGLDMYADHSTLTVAVNGATPNIYCRSSADNNTFDLGKLSGSAGNDIDGASGAINNVFIGGSLAGAVNIADASWRFYGSPQFENYGTESVTTNGSGNANIAHGLAGTPRTVSVTIDGDVAYQVDVQAVDGTNIQVRLKNPATNADVAATQNVMWRASL